MSSVLPQSLRFRLPLLVSLIVTAVLALFLWTVTQALNETLLQSAGVRLQTAADQLAPLLSQGAMRLNNQAKGIASAPALQEFLRNPSSGSRAEAEKLLMPLTAPGQRPVEVRDNSGAVVLRAASATGPLADTTGEAHAPGKIGIGDFHVSGGEVGYDITIEVDGLGTIVVHRSMVNPQASETLKRLIGGSGTIAIGNRSGDGWSDFSKPQPAPRVATDTPGVARYRAGDGTARIGALSLAPESPWAIWVESPEALVLQPARTLALRMTALALLFVGLAAAAVGIVSVRITEPLLELTHAAEAMAAGEFSLHVRSRRDDEIGRLGGAFNAMAAHVGEAHRTLEARVAERTDGLQRANQELEAFSYSVSHDLRAPLRHVAGFASLLQQSVASLGDQEKHYVATIVASAKRMGQLIDDLLSFSRIGRTELSRHRLDLNQLILEVQREVATDPAAARVSWQVHPLPTVEGDRALLRLALINLVSNAVKYSSTRPNPEIEIGTHTSGGPDTVVFVRDNGVGFDMAYASKLFGVFQRLHRQEEFEGTGIGLANVRRIIERHGGRVWAESTVDHGATFSFSLPRSHAAERI